MTLFPFLWLYLQMLSEGENEAEDAHHLDVAQYENQTDTEENDIDEETM